MRIVVINGSARRGRASIHVSRYLQSFILKETNYQVDLLDVGAYNFPIMEERMRFLEQVPPEMNDFSNKMRDADGLVIVTPEYNGSYSGVLKNTLDYFKTEYENKPMALVTVSNGATGGANAMHHLLAWAVHVKGIVSPYKLYVSAVDRKFDGTGSLLEADFDRSVSFFLNRFFWLAKAIKVAGAIK